MRIAGFNIPDNKRVDIALTYLYGIGRKNVKVVLAKAGIEAEKRVSKLSEEEQKKIRTGIDKGRNIFNKSKARGRRATGPKDNSD